METRDRVVSARVTPAEYTQLMLIAKAYAPPGQKPNVSIPVREAIAAYLKEYGTAQ